MIHEHSLEVAIIKNDPKDKAQFDVPGKDSYKFSDTGAEVIVTSPTRTTYFSQRHKELDEIIALFGDFDVLLVEGLKNLPLPRISIFRSSIDTDYFPYMNALAIDDSIDPTHYSIPRRYRYTRSQQPRSSDRVDFNSRKGYEMNEILEAIEQSAIRIKNAIDVKDIGYSQEQNSSGETQLQLDIQSDLIIEEELSHVEGVHTIASEEKEVPMVLNEKGHYFIAFDPLDGSSLVDVNLSVGSIFGIYEGEFTPSKMVASCYVVYGPRVELVFADENMYLSISYKTVNSNTSKRSI